jgi:Fur family ferric uptake transcriptional regulator
VIEAEPEIAAELVDRLAADRGFTTDVRHLTLFGTCRECSGSA